MVTEGVEIDRNEADCFDKTVIIKQGASGKRVKVGTEAKSILVESDNCAVEVDGSVRNTISVTGDNVRLKVEGDACDVFALEGEKNEINVNGRITGEIELSDTTHIA